MAPALGAGTWKAQANRARRAGSTEQATLSRMWLLVACAPNLQDESARKPASVADTDEDVARAPLQFRFPLADRTLFDRTIGVDHDPEVHGSGVQGVICTSYDGRSFPACYDEHEGS